MIDTLKLHDDMAVLRPMFADPSIVKVSAETLSNTLCNQIQHKQYSASDHRCHPKWDVSFLRARKRFLISCC